MDMEEIAVRSWSDVEALSEERRAALAFGEALLVFPDGRRYRRETGPRLDMHFVIDLGGDEREVHDLFANVDDPDDLYCLLCGPLDGARLQREAELRGQAGSGFG